MDFDLHRLEQFLLSRVENIQGPMTLERIKGGSQTPPFLLTSRADGLFYANNRQRIFFRQPTRSIASFVLCRH